MFTVNAFWNVHAPPVTYAVTWHEQALAIDVYHA